MTPETSQRFAQYEPRIRPVLLHMARRFAGGNPAEADDLYQTGSIALLSAINDYRPERGEVGPWAREVLRRTFSKLIRDRCRKRRTPHVWAQTESGWEFVPVGTTTLDGADDITPAPDQTPEEQAAERERERAALARVHRKLTPFQRKVLDLYLAPTPALLAVARNTTGGFKIDQKHLAAVLGVPLSRIDYAIRQIRRVAGVGFNG